MRNYLAMGLFAFFVTIVSLVRILGRDEFFRLTAMKRAWGRGRGLLMYFLANVALPLVLGIVFFAQGIVGLPGPRSAAEPRISLLSSAVAAASGQVGSAPGTTALPGKGGDDRVGVLPRDLHWFRVP